MTLHPSTPDFHANALDGYITCALWASTDDDGDPMDGLYTIDDFAAETEPAMAQDLDDFIGANIDDLAGMEPERVGHDFWLTRNGHGAGFWDRGLGERGDRLTKACRPYGESDLYIGDDGKVYVS